MLRPRLTRARLAHNFQCQSEWHRAFTPHFGLKRFALDQFHHIEAFFILFAVMADPRNIRMMNLRSGPRFTQKARPYACSLRDLSINHFQRDHRIQNCIARAVGYGHRSGTELNRKTVCSRLYLKVSVSQWSRS